MYEKRIKNKLTVMTWNIYQGTDFTPLVNTTPEEVPEVVTSLYNNVLQTDFNARARAIVRQIKQTQPDLIGLQEVTLYTIKSLTSISKIDFLKILLKSLRRQGLWYRVVATNNNFTGELPSSTGDIIEILDRDVILAKYNKTLEFTNIQENNFETNLVVSIGNEPFPITRGWSSVDITMNGKQFRLLNTHLESASVSIREAQVNELIEGPAITKLPLLFIGDYNSNAYGNDPVVYDNLIFNGFIDCWDLAGEYCGFTSVQRRDLRNRFSILFERVDLILFKSRITKDFYVQKIDTVGDKQKDKTVNRLWPSDHAGVYAILEF